MHFHSFYAVKVQNQNEQPEVCFRIHNVGQIAHDEVLSVTGDHGSHGGDGDADPHEGGRGGQTHPL